MFKVNIIQKNTGIVSHIGEFSERSEVDSWIQTCEMHQSWGKTDRWVKDINLTPEEILLSEDSREIEISPEVLSVEGQEELYDEETGEIIQERIEAVSGSPAVVEIEYFFSKSYTIQIEDLTIQAQTEAKVVAGKAAREACQLVLDFISGTNLDKELTIQQITQMQQTYANAEAALRAARPTLAKSLISAIEPDGVLVTEQEKSTCLELLKSY